MNNIYINIKDVAEAKGLKSTRSLRLELNKNESKYISILGQTLTTEIGSTGSYAASNTHMQVRQDIVDSDKKLVEGVINQLIQWIYEINFAKAIDRIEERFGRNKIKVGFTNKDVPNKQGFMTSPTMIY